MYVVALSNLDSDIPFWIRRVIHVYRHHGTVYFLSIESRWLDPEDPPARRFFDSLRIGKAAKVDQ